jgi:hypothetical protein
VYFALGCAALTFAITRDAPSTISVIIVGVRLETREPTTLPRVPCWLSAIWRHDRRGATCCCALAASSRGRYLVLRSRRGRSNDLDQTLRMGEDPLRDAANDD